MPKSRPDLKRILIKSLTHRFRYNIVESTPDIFESSQIEYSDPYTILILEGNRVYNIFYHLKC